MDNHAKLCIFNKMALFAFSNIKYQKNVDTKKMFMSVINKGCFKVISITFLSYSFSCQKKYIEFHTHL